MVHRDFAASGPHELWVADLAYLRCWDGLVFFAFVIDAHSRWVVGRQLAGPHAHAPHWSSTRYAWHSAPLIAARTSSCTTQIAAAQSGLVSPTPWSQNGCNEGDVGRVGRSYAYRLRVVASHWRQMLGQLELVLAWREVEAESIIPRRHVLACNPCATGIEYAHIDAEMTAVKYDRANYRPRTATTVARRRAPGWGAAAPRRERAYHHGTYDACCGPTHVIEWSALFRGPLASGRSSEFRN